MQRCSERPSHARRRGFGANGPPGRGLRASAVLLSLLLVVASGPGVGQQGGSWILVPEDSAITFTSVKNGVITEAHAFEDFRGVVRPRDGARLIVELASVDTLVPIRDERMRNLLFEVARFPTAEFRAAIGPELIEDLEVGRTRRVEVTGSLVLRGREHELAARLLVSRLGSDRVQIVSAAPVIVSADALGMHAGLERLREVAGLESIAPMVPVNLALTFARTPG